ncbi:hypothetical protein Ping_0448 [Psychromonas ingrahamii 37]|uniref:Uncharacterized protein n=1 Tax=Psychromonas ingrahamii (strain DSM 17664 / CCUG 51855 / 37) TaxID=357804 RepID=A1SS41_PSYIN|nr:hypothetical protein [Psychromonas ingrahamii]ABM02306.1 hypothetical protein Ping_0448 [Psychromonas ingrahamii 37]
MKLKITIILLGFYCIFINALTGSILVPTFHLDGAFQTASGLFRLDSGQLPGKDFFPYLGIGPILIIFPVFKLAGSDLIASSFSTLFVTRVLAWVSVSLVVHLILRSKSFISSLCIGIILLIILIGIDKSGFFINKPFSFLIDPGTSLRPVRASAPYLLGILSYFIVTTSIPYSLKKYLAGVSAGIFLLWSNDYALPTVATFSLFFCIYFYKNSATNWLKDALVFSLILISTWLVLLLLITAGHPLELLKYNFRDVATDQWWYFSPYYDRIFHLSDLGKLINADLLILLVFSIYAYKTKYIESIILCIIGFALFFGGVLASIGGHFTKIYFNAYHAWAIIIAIIFTINLIVKLISKNIQSNQILFLRNLVSPSIIICLLMVASAGSYKYYRNLNSVQNNKYFYYIDEFGGYLNVKWKDYIEFIKLNKHKPIIEEYWGLASALNRTFSPWPVDSVIHALGDVRKKAQDSLVKADYIITSKNGNFSIWQPWSVSQNFWFYKTLFSEWEPIFHSPATTIWKKLPHKRTEQNVECEITKNRDAFTIKTDKTGLINVKLNYSITAKGRYLSMVKNNLSYASDAAGYVSINPKSDNAFFPVLSKGDENEIYDAKIVGSDNGEIIIESCEASRFIIDLDDEDEIYPSVFK